MKVQLLVVPGRPNESSTAGLLRGLLDELGLTRVPVPVRVVDTQDEADRRGFTGSPTVLIDGRDPFAESERGPAVACRVYATPTGLAGVPDAAALRTALLAAADVTGGGRR